MTRSQWDITGSDISCQDYNTKDKYLKLICYYWASIAFTHEKQEVSTNLSSVDKIRNISSVRAVRDEPIEIEIKKK
jgi:hypothetical protein